MSSKRIHNTNLSHPIFVVQRDERSEGPVRRFNALEPASPETQALIRVLRVDGFGGVLAAVGAWFAWRAPCTGREVREEGCRARRSVPRYLEGGATIGERCRRSADPLALGTKGWVPWDDGTGVFGTQSTGRRRGLNTSWPRAYVRGVPGIAAPHRSTPRHGEGRDDRLRRSLTTALPPAPRRPPRGRPPRRRRPRTPATGVNSYHTTHSAIELGEKGATSDNSVHRGAG